MSEINVIHSTQRIICYPAPRTVSVIFTGPPGETGPAGPTGATGPTGPTGPSGHIPVFISEGVRDGVITAPTDGMMCVTTNNDTLWQYVNSAWVSRGVPGQWIDFTPTVGQGSAGNLTKTIHYSRYIREGRKITFAFQMSVNAGGISGQVIFMTLPAGPAALYAGAIMVIGSAYFSDNTGQHVAHAVIETVNQRMQFLPSDHVFTNYVGADPVVNSAFIVTGTVVYEAAA